MRNKIFKYIIAYLGKVIIGLITLVGITAIIMFIIGYRPFLLEGLYDWEAMGAISQIVAAIATFMAVIVALDPIKMKLAVNFRMLDYSFANDSVLNSIPRLVITNIDKRTIVIHEIVLYFSNEIQYSIDLLSESKDRNIIAKVNNEEFEKITPIILNPGQTTKIEFDIMNLEHPFGHAWDEPSEQNKDRFLYIIIRDSFGYSKRYKINIKFDEFYKNIVEILEERYKIDHLV